MADMMAESEHGAHVPFLGYKREETKHLGANYNSFEAGPLGKRSGLRPLRRKDAVEYELRGCLSMLRWGWECMNCERLLNCEYVDKSCLNSCPIATISVLVSVEILVAVCGLILGFVNAEVHCERNLQALVISFGALQLAQTMGAVGLIYQPKGWRSCEDWFAPVVITSGFARFVGMIVGCALVFKRKGQCDPDLLHHAKWYMIAQVAMMASSMCYMLLLVHPSFTPKWDKQGPGSSIRRRRSISVLEVGRRASANTVQMTKLANNANNNGQNHVNNI
mmetsp:Transcript_499/g.828  ORF Transcript_499/g.828 Transcript_499/m.828 type:complete len:278 (+) Transcript_499:38-871(+)